MAKCVTLLLVIFFQVVMGGLPLPFLPTPEGKSVYNMVNKGLEFADNHGTRRPRSLVSILTLLWPQVVGPMHDGIIKEDSFDDIPKTTIEFQLDGIRERSAADLETRQHIRYLLNEGPPPSSPLAELHMLHQLHPALDTLPVHPTLDALHVHPTLEALPVHQVHHIGLHGLPGHPHFFDMLGLPGMNMFSSFQNVPTYPHDFNNNHL